MTHATHPVASLMSTAARLRLGGFSDSAARRLLARHHGDVHAAIAALEDRKLDRQAAAFVIEWRRLEKQLIHRDAWGRWAALHTALQANGTLGWRTSMLLIAAGDAAITPGVDHWRAKLTKIVGGEIDRRYPVRRENDWQVIDPDTKHGDRLRAAISDEQHTRDLVLSRRPELAQKIDAMASSRQMRRGIERVLHRVSELLRDRAVEGWTPDPVRYQREVIDQARAHALSL